MRNIVIDVMMIASHTDGERVFSAYIDHSVQMFVLVIRFADD